jgi:integrase
MRGEWRLVIYRGKWCAYTADEWGKPRRRSLGTADRALAERRFSGFLAELSRPPQAGTLGDIIHGYIESLAGRARARQEMTLRAIRKVTTPNLLALRPDALSIDDCRAYAAARRRQGKSDGTIRADLGLVRTALNWAVKRKWLAQAPHVEMPAPPPPRDRWLSAAEASKLLQAAGQPHLRLFILLALHTAARSAAILELTWDRVNDRFLDLNPAGARRGKGRAVVPMNAELWQALEEARRGAVSEHVIEWAGRPVRSVKKAFAKAATAAGLDDVTPHTLRHTAASWMVQAGVPLAKVAAYLGHSNTRMVEQVYGKHAPDYLADASQAIVTRLHGVRSTGSIEQAGRERTGKTGRKRPIAGR